MNCSRTIATYAAAMAIAITMASQRVFSSEGVIPIGLTYSHSHGPPDLGYWGSVHVPTIDQLGHIAFRADFRDVTHSNYDVAYRASDDQFIARAGDQAPGLAAGVNFRFLSNFQTNPRGPAGF